MKTLTVFCLFISAIFFGQTETAIVPEQSTKSANELGLNLFSINDLAWSRYHTTNLKFKSDYDFGTGIYYKRHSGKNAWRASFNYYHKSVSVYNNNHHDLNYFYSSIGIKKAAQITAGYQRDFLDKKFTPYVFADVLFHYSDYSGFESYSGDFTWANNVPFIQEDFEYGLDAGFGLKYKVTKNITLSCETSAQEFYSVSQYLNSTNGKFKLLTHRLNPLSQLGFAVAF